MHESKLNIDKGSFTNISFKMRGSPKKALNYNLPAIIYSEVKSDVFLFGGRFRNMRNCRLLTALKLSSILTNNITVSNRDFDFETQNLNFKHGTSAFYIQDSGYIGSENFFSDIFSPNRGGTVLHLKTKYVGTENFF